ncbi:MAG: hypothetical protein JW706_03185 [Opitutales bacterium]|nr:hypothetical protein [Opitutales bacterium]
MNVDWSIIERSFAIVVRMLKLTVPSIFLVQFMRDAGWLRFLDKYALAVVRFTSFDKQIGEAFFASLGSAHAGSGILIDLHRKGILTTTGIILASVYNSIGPNVRIIVTYTIPAAFSLLPTKTAFAYVGFMLIHGFFKSLSAGLLSHLLPVYRSGRENDGRNDNTTLTDEVPLTMGSAVSVPAWKSALLTTWILCRRAIPLAFASSLVIYWLDSRQVFEALPIDPAWFGMPADTLRILAAWFAHFYAGLGMVGQAAAEGRFSDLEAFRLCLFCAIASRPVFFIKEAPGYYFGLYGFRVGFLLFLYHMGSLVLFGSLVLMLTRS